MFSTFLFFYLIIYFQRLFVFLLNIFWRYSCVITHWIIAFLFNSFIEFCYMDQSNFIYLFPKELNISQVLLAWVFFYYIEFAMNTTMFFCVCVFPDTFLEKEFVGKTKCLLLSKSPWKKWHQFPIEPKQMTIHLCPLGFKYFWFHHLRLSIW